MILGMTRGDVLLVVFIFGLIYIAGLLPRIAARLAGEDNEGAQTKPNGD